MDFLKGIIGDELYKQLETALNAHNGKSENKDKQIKIGNLGTGEYVSKGKFDTLQATLDGKLGELQTANNLITELKNGNKDNSDLQTKVTTYENQVKDLQNQLAETKLKAAIKVALLSEKAVDVDYLTFKLETKLKDEKRTLELDDNGNIRGWTDLLSSLKTQFPAQFESSTSKKVKENKLDNGNSGNGTLTKAELLKMPYAERAKYYDENPDAYNEIMKG